MLYDQGKLNFTEPLQQFIPEFKDPQIRLYHLLTHTSGIRGWIPHRDELNHDELLKALINCLLPMNLNTRCAMLTLTSFYSAW